ncbi:MAG: hypothetical protein C5B52_16690 [Bacteroidetes bacterium]|nr:MAG: hypothetical protein C5B52_16690 [Bacteroidota bacterium]
MFANLVSYKKYLLRTVQWLIGNFIIALCPLLFMLVIKLISNNKAGVDEYNRLIKDGAVLFVCCSMMGSVVIDYILGKHLLSGWKVLVIYFYPFAILSFLLMSYLLIYFKIIDTSYFNLDSKTSLLVIFFTISYCIFAKSNLLVQEDNGHAAR